MQKQIELTTLLQQPFLPDKHRTSELFFSLSPGTDIPHIYMLIMTLSISLACANILKRDICSNLTPEIFNIYYLIPINENNTGF